MPDYLKNLGIDRWTLRQNSAAVLPACYAYELLQQGKPVGVLFAAAASEDAAIAELLKKIIVALQCEPCGNWYSMQPDYSELSDLRFVITLGEGFDVDASLPHFQSYAPQRLIAEPKLKAETWKTLQAVFSI